MNVIILLSLLTTMPSAAIQPMQNTDLLPRRGALGLPILAVPQALAEKYRLKPGQAALAGKPIAGLTAEKAGVHEGDIILEMNGSSLELVSFVDNVRKLVAGKVVSLKIIRDGKQITVSAPLKEKLRDLGNDKYEVIYSSVKTIGGRMRTIISKPKSPGRHPALFFIQGAAGNSYDFNLNSSGIDAPILQDFATRDFVTLRVEKPGVGDSEGGPFTTLDFNTELDIYRQAIKQLKSLEYTDPDKIFVFGHSMGGAFGPMIACESPVRGLAMYGIAARTWHEYLMDITRYQGRLGGMSYSSADDAVRKANLILTQVFELDRTPQDVVKDRPELKNLTEELFPNGLFNGRATAFWRQLVKTNFANYWEKCNTHVLAVHGKSDFVTYDVDHQLVADIVNSVHPGWGRFEIAENSDHAFSAWATEAESRRHFPAGTFSPVFLNLMRSWVDNLLKTNG